MPVTTDGHWAAIQKISELLNVKTEFTDGRESKVAHNAETMSKILAGAGYDVSTEETAAATLKTIEKEIWKNPLAPDNILTRDRAEHPEWMDIPITLPADQQNHNLVLTVKTETGAETKLRSVDFSQLPLEAKHDVDGTRYQRRMLRLSNYVPRSKIIPDGFNEITLEADGKNYTAPLIMTPPQAYLTEGIKSGKEKHFGITDNFYTHRNGSEKITQNWGIGDFGDLRDLVVESAKEGVDMVGIPPITPLAAAFPQNVNPYGSIARNFIDHRFIAVGRLPEFETSKAAKALCENEGFKSILKKTRESEKVEYGEVWTKLKEPVLEQLFREFRDAGANAHGYQEFERFKKERGDELNGYALYQTISEAEGKYFTEWPGNLKANFDNTTIDRARGHYHKPFHDFSLDDRIEFHKYLQFLANRQLEEVKQAAEAGGMKIGLYGDLAVATDGCGFDTWKQGGAYFQGLQPGAPGDQFTSKGQAWGGRAFNPIALRKESYKSIADLLTQQLKPFKALRIDHVLGLLRGAFSIPEGAKSPNDEGTYFMHDQRKMAGVLALLSQRAKCVLIGEDLGNVPDGFREMSSGWGILGYDATIWNREWKKKNEGEPFIEPKDFRRLAVAATGLHDLPPFIAFWKGEDIDLKNAHGILDDVKGAKEYLQKTRVQIVKALKKQKLLRDDFEPKADLSGAEYKELFSAYQKFSGMSQSAFVTTTFDDISHSTRIINIPGISVSEKPDTWAIRTPSVEEVVAKGQLHEFAEVMRETRKVSNVDIATTTQGGGMGQGA